MVLFFFTFGGLAIAFTMLALGALLGRAPLRRGCSELGPDACETCARPCARRRAATDADRHPDPED